MQYVIRRARNAYLRVSASLDKNNWLTFGKKLKYPPHRDYLSKQRWAFSTNHQGLARPGRPGHGPRLMKESVSVGSAETDYFLF